MHDKPTWAQWVGSDASRLWAVVAALTLLVLAVQGAPFEFKAGPTVWMSLTPRPWWALVGNVLLLVPFGFAEVRLGRRVLPWRALVILGVAADASMLAMVGEVLQAYIPTRESSMLDLFAQILGAAIGAAIGQHE